LDEQKKHKENDRQPFTSNLDTDKAMKGLNTELRNQFFHFKLKDWSIIILLIKEIIQKTLPIIIFIVFEGRRMLIEENERLAIDGILKKITLQGNP